MPAVASTSVPAPVTGAPVPAARLRRLAALVAAGLFLAPLAPWYTQSVTAPGVHGTRRIVSVQSGWQSLGLAPLVCAIAGLGLVALLALRGRARVEGLGAAGRRAARARVDGRLVSAGGALCLVLLLGTLAHHPGPAVALPGASSTTALGSGVALAGLLALALVTAGIAITRAAALAEYGARPARPARAGRGRSVRSPGRGFLRSSGSAGIADESTDDGPVPEFDFALAEPGAPPRTRR